MICAEFAMGLKFLFPNGKHLFPQFVDKSLNLRSYLIMLRLKCEQPYLCKLPILFSKASLKLGHNFYLFIHRFKIEIFECWF